VNARIQALVNGEWVDLPYSYERGMCERMMRLYGIDRSKAFRLRCVA
jgi:hypothetical protein